MKTWKWTRMNWKVMLAVLMGMTICLAPAQAADVPIVVDALAKTQQAPNDEGAWQITASVKMYSYTRGVGFSNKMEATGLLSAVPASADELSGTLAMRVDDGPYFTHKLRLHVARDGKVGIQWLVKNKPYLGREMEFYQTEATGEDSFVAQGINWNNFKRTLIVTLSTKRVKAGTRPFIRVPVKTPIGKRYKITGRLVVTDSSDGYGDNTVEIYGFLLLTQRGWDKKIGQMQDRSLVTIIPQPLGKNASLPADQNLFVDHIFANPKTECLKIRAGIYDDDDVSADDPMNVDETRLRSLASFKNGEEHNLPGDRDSENVEVYYNVTFVKDLY